MTYLFLHRQAVLRRACFLAIAFISALFSIILLLQRVIFEFLGPYNLDGPIYWAVGRGILNGYTPYIDLFETKPPAIFLLSSLSFYLFDSVRLTSVLQGIVIALFPALLLYATWRKVQGTSRFTVALSLLVSLSFGSFLALYIGDRAGQFQVESFGALFTLAFALSLPEQKATIRRSLLLGFLLFSAVSFKEPFLLVAIACVLLKYAASPHICRSLWFSLGLPILIAGILHGLFLSLIGFLWPYLQVYLPEMLGRHIFAAGPLLPRALRFLPLFKDLADYSIVLCYIVLLLLFLHILSGVGHSHSAILRIRAVLMNFAALILLALTVGMGGQYYLHHFIFAAPAYAALFLLCLRTPHTEVRFRWVRSAACIFLGASSLVGLIFLPSPKYEETIAGMRRDIAQTAAVAEKIDATMDACGLDRYLFIGQNGLQPYAFTRHTPMGPLFFQYQYLMNDARPQFQQSTMSNLFSANFVVLQRVEFDVYSSFAQEYIRQHFTPFPWACAQPFSDGSQPYTFYYRTQRTDDR